MNPYDVLDLTQDADDKSIQKAYRKKSLLIHPDKMADDQARAEEAFDLLKKSLDHLLDADRRKLLDETVVSAVPCITGARSPNDTHTRRD